MRSRTTPPVLPINNDVDTIEHGIRQCEEATEHRVARWEVDDATNTVTVEFLPPPPIEPITHADVLAGIQQAEAWFATNPVEALT